MSIPSSPMCLLLDKNVVRRGVNGLLRLARGQEPPPEEEIALVLLQKAAIRECKLLVAQEIVHILVRKEDNGTTIAVQTFLRRISVLKRTRYFKRWARRLRRMNFTREDAKVLSLATFGTDEAGEILSVSVIVTFDQRLISKYAHELAVIRGQFEAMMAGLEPPFCYARLPEVILPQKALGLIQ
jgi:hypothetical protein